MGVLQLHKDIPDGDIVDLLSMIPRTFRNPVQIDLPVPKRSRFIPVSPENISIEL